MHNVHRLLIFFIIFCILWNIVFNVLWLSKNTIINFYVEPKNSLDIAYVGSSTAYISFNSTLAYNLYGFTTGMFATNAVPFVATKYSLIEIQKMQSPSLYIIDLGLLANDPNSFTEGNIRLTVDSFKFSKNRFDLINDTLKYTDNLKEDLNLKSHNKYEFYYSYLLYHNMWKNLSKNNINNDELFKGYLLSDLTLGVRKLNNCVWKNGNMDLQENNKNVLLDLLDYIKVNDLKVLFVVPIKCYDLETNKRLNSAIKIVENYNYNIINFNTLDDFKINYETDYYDNSHLNVYGSTKYTLYFSKYLKENYDLPNHKNDKKYLSWDNEFKRFKIKFKELTGKNFD